MPAEMQNAVELTISALVGGGLTELIRAFSRRRKDRVDSTATLNDSTLKWAEALKRDSDESRAEAQEAWKELRRRTLEMQDELRQTRQQMDTELTGLVTEMHKHRQLAEVLTYRFRVVIGAIMSPSASVESLRQLVSDPSFGGHNGNGG